MNPNLPPGVMPFPLVLTTGNYPVQTREPQVSVPPRVQVAIGALSHFTDKTAQKPLPERLGHESEISFRPIDGQRLTHDETELQKAACTVIKDYITGKLRRTQWDGPRPGEEDDTTRFAIPCPNCRGRAQLENIGPCPFCNGKGAVLVVREGD